MIKYFILAIVTAAFAALVVGGVYDISPPTDTAEAPSDEGFWAGFADAVIGVLTRIWGIIIFILGAITFNVPGAPWYVRTLIAVVIGAPILWGVAKMIRGTS